MSRVLRRISTERLLLDTNTVSYIVRGKSAAARATLAGLAPQQIPFISAITEAELRYGLAKNRRATMLSVAIEGFLAKMQILSWGSAEAAAYGELRAAMEAAGTTLGNLDMLIAAQAIALDATLVTSDKAFAHVPNLPGRTNWATDLQRIAGG